MDADSQILQQLQLQLSQDTEDVRISIVFDHDTVTSGDYVPMKKAEAAPSISVEGRAVDSAELFTYVLVDIDAPDPKAPTHAPFLHYILADLSVDEQGAQGEQQQEEVVVVPYYPVTPPVGEHRYVSLLFRQQGDNLDGHDTTLTEKRSNFDVAGFATEHKLELVTTSSFHSHQDD
ncbi:hypothetical protein BBJ29_000617 [Phytophthora kernoviae]|uniref:Phosphatidylethanolamine-binding protein n=1 Tax=Phytophthora kernoviae TaxID=325452 RepID=A0A3F2S020_9STRA|nr:hypothetical protein BBJ29_000617 [Phytophthora kernoviae]RLN67631.1 hypothetical protein BBP00_00001496 [Phytophthora kernoviae]